MRNATLLSTGAYVPKNKIKNSYFDALLGENVSAWLEENVHIYERYWCTEEESTLDLAEKAAQQALERADLSAATLDLIIIATDTPEYLSPSTASILQHRLGAVNAGTFDVNTACAGFVTALDIACKYIRSDDQYDHVLVIGAYAMSKHLNKKDKKTVTLFADGAGAVVLKAKNTRTKGYLKSQLLTQGQYYDAMGIYAGGAKQPVNKAVIDKQEHQLVFAKRIDSSLNVNVWSKMIEDLCQRIGVTPNDVNHYFFTQININSIWRTLDTLAVPREKGHTVMQKFGYTGSACIPMVLNDVWEKKELKKGDLIFFIGSGGGLAFASLAFRL
jgi:3-oxoacyl-[acyl-carrier-protein] synthase-3